MTDPNKPANQQVHRSVASSNWTRTEQFKRLKLFYTLESACEVVPFVLLESNAAEQQEQKKAEYSESKPERVSNLSTGLCVLPERFLGQRTYEDLQQGGVERRLRFVLHVRKAPHRRGDGSYPP